MISPKNLLDDDDLFTLLQSAHDLTSQIDFDELLKNILYKACELTNSPDSSVILLNKAKNTLYFAEAIGENADMLLGEWGENAQKSVPLTGSKSGEVFSTSQPIILNQIESHFEGVDKDTQKNTQSMICVPLKVTGQRLGVMQILNKKSGDYDKRDLVLLEYFSTLASIAIRNAQLFKELMIHMGFNSLANKKKGTLDFFAELEKPARTEMLTIMFVDMRGFTQLCQILNNPNAAQQHLNDFLKFLTEEIVHHNGSINKILGDGVLALFRDKDHAVDAVRCAFSMIDRFKKIKKDWVKRHDIDITFIDIGMGIVTDTVIIGTIAGEFFRDFTVIGNAVNLAAAFEKNAKNGKRILVNELTFTATENLIAEVEGPIDFELRKTGMTFGNKYKQYHIKKLKEF